MRRHWRCSVLPLVPGLLRRARAHVRLYFEPVPDGEVVEGLVDVVPDDSELPGKVVLPEDPADPVFELLPEVSVELVPEPVEPDPIEPEDESLVLLPLPEPELLVSPGARYVGEDGVLRPELPVPDVEPDVPESPEVPEVPLVLPDPELDVSPLLPDVPEEESEVPLDEGAFLVVVVVVVAVPLLPEEESEPEVDALLLPEGLDVVVVVVVVWAKVAVAVPISDKKIAKGNFFMSAPL